MPTEVAAAVATDGPDARSGAVLARSALPVGRHPATVVSRLTARKCLRSGGIWGVVFGVYVALQAQAYVSTYPTQAARVLLAKSFSSGGLNALMGPARNLATVPGYTAWKSLGALSVIGAVWALLLATKLLRGEEDAGRWELLLAGQTTRRGAAVQALAGLGIGLIALLAGTALITVVVGSEAKVGIGLGAALFFAVSVCSGAVMFMAAGALASQLAASRRQAAAYVATALGASFALRMVADSSSALSWLSWASPLGWIDRLQPLTDPQPAVLIPIFGLTATLAAMAVSLAGGRDLGASTLPDRASTRAHMVLLGGPVGLDIRLGRAVVLGWLAGVCAFGLLLGAVAKEAAKSLAASPSVEAALERMSGRGGVIRAYLGVSFLLLALLVVFTAAGQITGARREEATGRVEHLLVRPVGRSRWLWGRFAVGAGVVVVAGVLAGVLAWLGTLSQHAGISAPAMLGAGLNVVPPALLLLGIGVLALGLTPRLASGAVYGVLAWSFLVELLGGIVNSNHWLLDTSIFHQMQPAPAIAPDWTSGLGMIAAGAAAAAVGVHAFGRRDLAGE
ncbi:MAG TPA: ABC transporter permease subunit [Acidimicrobiales bacterium]|nr:ABC transporter permease subunit [Acidimicrobiales bacterium]